MDAGVVVIQTPGNFECSDENLENMKEILRSVDIGNLTLGWEPRGDWNKNKEKIKEICNELDLIHIVDIMRREPVSDRDIAYTRLHGLNEDEYDYNYAYSEKELKRLAEKLKDLDDNHKKVYCLFNNYEMYENANRLMKILKK